MLYKYIDCDGFHLLFHINTYVYGSGAHIRMLRGRHNFSLSRSNPKSSTYRIGGAIDIDPISFGRNRLELKFNHLFFRCKDIDDGA